MSIFLAELIGTAVLIIIGNGVVANVVLPKTKGHGGGLLAICFGWALAVFIAVYMTGSVSGAHLNSAVTIALAVAGKFSWSDVPLYLTAQLLGAMLGAFFVWLTYRQHFDASEDASMKLASFCTGPSISNPLQNLLTETIATAVFILGVLFITKADASLGSLDALPVALLVMGIGLGLGGPTGWAINPARDLGPRIMHALLPIKNKGGSNWSYSWVPVLGPVIGACLAVFVYQLLMG
ncbi:MIP/aquaporin family protein [Sediminibacterium goheungense]|uniref:Glycerol uptake facilitator protein n=1 Tax=Sediminibacterium goheungense TaxID=1086393 RepID=A0A4R6IW84_9BACT|nr:MIP/aquaporin family protein [Sediminibacterium goheungense]TDO26950.1 glycerol uptake facilitator protein [Sediminibacterium goheungense]